MASRNQDTAHTASQTPNAGRTSHHRRRQSTRHCFFQSVFEKTDWKKQWRVFCRRRWWLVLPAFGVWLAVWAVSWFLPAIYRSETVILVEQQKVPEQYVVPNVSVDLQDRLQSMTQQILSRTRLQATINRFALYS